MRTAAATVAIVLMSIVVLASMAGAEPKPIYPYSGDLTAEQLQALIREKPDMDFAPMIQLTLGGGGGSVAVDPLAIKDASAEGGILAHLQRNWGRYTTGAVVSGVALYGNHRDWWHGSSSSPAASPAPNVTSNGHTTTVTTTGDNSPVVITINAPPVATQ